MHDNNNLFCLSTGKPNRCVCSLKGVCFVEITVANFLSNNINAILQLLWMSAYRRLIDDLSALINITWGLRFS